MKVLLKYKRYFAILSLLIIAGTLRIVNLGYSDYQGDEIKALFLPDASQSIMEFLLDQRKGPLQFFVTYAAKLLDPTYENQFLVRLPFALAGVLSVIFFYKFVENIFGKRVAYISAFLLATNGFFVAFGRIIQYQSFVILFCILTLYFLSKSLYYQENYVRNLLLSFIFFSFGCLAHYDALFIFPFVLFMLWKIYKKRAELGEKIKIKKHIMLSTLVFLVLTLWFYIPFIFYVTSSTLSYWTGRLTGDVSSKLSSSKYLFTVYQPIYVVHFYTALMIAFVIGLSFYFIYSKFKSPKITAFLDTLSFSYMYNQNTLSIVLWAILAVFFWEVIVYIPGTHIYTYLLPLFILLAIGLSFLEKVVFALFIKSKNVSVRVIHGFFYFGLVVLGLFIFLQSYFIYVDNAQEYPWEEEKFLIWTFSKPTPMFHLSMFGFPYYRDWEGVRAFVAAFPNVTHYSTNERESISRYYIKLPKDTNQAGLFVYVTSPQSYTDVITQEKAVYWLSKYTPVFTFSRSGETLVAIYNMEPGGLNEIKLKGF